MPRTRNTLNVPPGDKLGYARDLAAAKAWPPKRIKRLKRDVPPATPFIVLPVDANDLGNRPLTGSEAVHSDAVEIVDSAGNAVTSPVAGTPYTLRATIRNLGAAPSYAGVAEFAVADAADVDAAASGASVVIPTLSIQGFVAQSGQTVTVTCSKLWAPADPNEASATIVVQAYDLLLDPVQRRFDARGDRHVGRKDTIPDFSGTWDGLQYFAPAPAAGQGLLYRVVVDQTGAQATVKVYAEVSTFDGGSTAPLTLAVAEHAMLTLAGTATVARAVLGRGGRLRRVLPSTPQLVGSTTVVNRQLQLSITEMLDLNGPGQPAVPFTTNDLTLTLPTPDTLHVTQHTVFVDPGDTRGPQDLFADLTRSP